MNNYEIILIFDPSLSDAIINEKIEFVKKWIEKLEGKIEKTNDNGIEKLAYEIRKSMQGHNVIIEFELDPLKIDTLKSELKLEESIWRIFIKKINKKVNND